MKAIFIKFQKKQNGRIFTGKVINTSKDGVFVVDVINDKNTKQFFPPFFGNHTFVYNNQIIN